MLDDVDDRHEMIGTTERVVVVGDGMEVVGDGIVVVGDGIVVVGDGIVVVGDGIEVVGDGMEVVNMSRKSSSSSLNSFEVATEKRTKNIIANNGLIFIWFCSFIS